MRMLLGELLCVADLEPRRGGDEPGSGNGDVVLVERALQPHLEQGKHVLPRQELLQPFERNDRAVLVQHGRERRDADNLVGLELELDSITDPLVQCAGDQLAKDHGPLVPRCRDSPRHEVHVLPQEAAARPAGHDNICSVVGGGDVQENARHGLDVWHRGKPGAQATWARCCSPG